MQTESTQNNTNNDDAVEREAEAPAVGFDLSDSKNVKDAEDSGRSVHIRDAAGNKMFYTDKDGTRLPVTIHVYGSYSKRYREAQNAQRKRMIKERVRNMTALQLEENQLELCVACIGGWQGIKLAGAEFGFTPANATRLLTNAPWVREQVEEAATDHESFSAGS